jgi:outer membrane protein OmpA-like peptidoglycan-associated protein
VSKRNLFVSFAESDGGHSYLAARAMLDANSIGHLIFRTTVSDVLDAVVAGQANFAVVPFYNSITQWDGATLKALASGQFEIHGQMCMPTSYVLAAHKEYMAEIVDRYQALSDKREQLSPERAKKIYTRFLTRIFVGSQAEEQYRGRLLRPDMAQATVEHSRNPLRVLEEIVRNELIKDLQYGSSRQARQQKESSFGGSPFVVDMPTRPGTISELNVPAALIASGLLDMQQDPDGWDRHGSVGEIVSLLRNLLELLDVYSFGAPDLPENKTQYLLVSKKGTALPAGALKVPAGAQKKRLMVLAKSGFKKSSSDQWMKPRERLETIGKDNGYVFDKSPLSVDTGGTRVFLMEGGSLKTQSPEKSKASGGIFSSPPKPKKSLREKIESKPEPKPKAGTPGDFQTSFLGEYATWCPPGTGQTDQCWCCDEAVEAHHEPHGILDWLHDNLPKIGMALGALLITAVVGYLLYAMFYCPLTGKCSATGVSPSSYQPPTVTGPTTPPSSPAPETAPPSTPDQVYPGQPSSPVSQLPPNSPYPQEPGTGDASQPTSPYPGYPGTGQSQPADQIGSSDRKPPVVEKPAPAAPVAERTSPVATTKPLMLHVAFVESKSNLSREAYNVLTTAAAQSLQSNRDIAVRVFALGSRESDGALWRRRLYAVKDELVRLGIPVQRIRTEGTGPYVLRITRLPQTETRRPASTGGGNSSDLDSLDDPFSNE